MLKHPITDAGGHLEQTLRLTPGNFQADYNLGINHTCSGNPIKALPDYQKAVRLQPKNARFQNELAGSLAALRKLDEAMQYCSLEINRDAVACLRALQSVQKKRRRKGA